jgi:hypothetical protein
MNVRSELRTKLAATLVGVTAAVVGVFLMSQRWVALTHGDCLRSPCYVRGHPYIVLGVLIMVVGLLVALFLWNSDSASSGPARQARRPSGAEPSDRPLA